MIPYTEHGNLIPGIHELSIHQLVMQFVDDFPNSDTRRDIIHKFKQWVQQLHSLVPPRYMWIDGSFLTTKVNPKDIDLVVFYTLEDLNPEVAARINELIHEVSRFLRCDAYLCFVNESEQENERKTYWQKQFGQDRDKNEKGIVQLNQDKILEIGGGVA